MDSHFPNFSLSLFSSILISTIVVIVFLATIYDIIHEYSKRIELEAILDENDVSIQRQGNIRVPANPQEIESLIKLEYEESESSLTLLYSLMN